MLLSAYLQIGDALEERGIFDPVLDTDNAFFINIQRLKVATTPEFVESYTRINQFFRKIIKLLGRAERKSLEDTYFKAAVNRFKFSEVNEIGLGFGKKSPGSGFGKRLSIQVLETAYDIVKAGIDDPEFFELLPLFQDKIGPDRLSDMIATLILPDIKKYTRRVNRELGITKERYPDKIFNDGFLCNPEKGYEIFLIPVEILHKLPVAESWDDIDLVVAENSIIRSVMNSEVAENWKRYAATERKNYLRELIFKDSYKCKEIIEAYKEVKVELVQLKEHIDYYAEQIWKSIENSNITWLSNDKNGEVDSKTASIEILKYFKSWVEYNGGNEVILEFKSKKKEKLVQKLIHLSASKYFKDNNLSMSCEVNNGRGPVDFKISRGNDITVIEVKLSSNSQYMHGYETQIMEYAKAEKTDNMIYVLIDLGHPMKVSKLRNRYNRDKDERKVVPDIIVIDSTKKLSASNYIKPQ